MSIKRKIQSKFSLGEKTQNLNEFMPVILIDAVSRSQVGIGEEDIAIVKYGDKETEAVVFPLFRELVGKKVAMPNEKLCSLLGIKQTESGEIVSTPKTVEINKPKDQEKTKIEFKEQYRNNAIRGIMLGRVR